MRPDPLSLPLPEGYQLELQSNKPIIRYCWLVRMDRGNKVWKCKLCNKEFTGSNIVVATHYWPKLSTQSCRKCQAVLPPALLEQLEVAWSNKKSADEVLAKKARVADTFSTVANRPASVSALLTAQSRPLADAAILKFLVVKGISVHVVNSPEFRDMTKSIRDAGPFYLPPNSHAFGKRSRDGNESGLGNILSSEPARLRLVKVNLLSGITSVGGTLCSDGAKWRKRNCLNSVLLTSFGAFFCQSTGEVTLNFY